MILYVIQRNANCAFMEFVNSSGYTTSRTIHCDQVLGWTSNSITIRRGNYMYLCDEYGDVVRGLGYCHN